MCVTEVSEYFQNVVNVNRDMLLYEYCPTVIDSPLLCSHAMKYNRILFFFVYYVHNLFSCYVFAIAQYTINAFCTSHYCCVIVYQYLCIMLQNRCCLYTSNVFVASCLLRSLS